MTRRQRTILFSTCAFLFVFSATIIVFYSQGFRFNFEKKKITQTGAFYFKAWPKSVEIYINDRLKKKTDFFFGSALIDNLLPEKYNVKIKKEGYFTWEKNLETKEKEVTDAKNVILIKESPNFFILIKGVESFFFSPDEKKIIMLETNKTGWELNLYNLENNTKSHLIKSIDIAKKDVDFLDLSFSPNSKKILLKTSIDESLKYYLLDIDKTPAELTSLDFLGKNVEEPTFSPRDSQKLFFLKAGILNEANLTKKEVSPTSLKDVFTWTSLNDSVYYLEKNGYLYKTDFSFLRRDKINETAFSLKKGAKYEISIFPDFFFVKEDENLYLFNPETKCFEKFLEKNKEIKNSPDLEKVMYSSDFEIWVLFLKKQENQPQKLAGDKLFLTRFSEKIGEVFWFSSHYLIFNIGDEIKISEIDERDRINIVDLASFKNPKIYFNQTDKKLYLLSEGNLFSSEELLP